MMMENQQVKDPLSMKFTWTIGNFSKLEDKKYYSDILIVGGYKWRISIYPKGNAGSENVDFSIYLGVTDDDKNLASEWSIYAEFSFSVINRLHKNASFSKVAEHTFNTKESNWGYESFMPLSELYDLRKGFVVNDTLVVEANIHVVHKDYFQAKHSSNIVFYKEDKENKSFVKVATNSTTVATTSKVKVDAEERTLEIFNAMMKIEGVTKIKKIRAVELLIADARKCSFFLMMPQSYRLDYVVDLLTNNGFYC